MSQISSVFVGNAPKNQKKKGGKNKERHSYSLQDLFAFNFVGQCKH